MKTVKEQLTNLICALGATQANIEILLKRKHVSKKRMRVVLALQEEITQKIEDLKNQL